MKRLLYLSLGLFLLSIPAFAQESTTKPAKSYARPDIPGTFVVELGFNRPFDRPVNFNIGLWGSRTLNIYYQYEIRILKSKFSFVPGIGFGLERYKFTNNYILINNNDNTSSLVPAGQPGYPGTKKSQLITDYFDIPLELRFSTRPEDPTKSFKVSIGGRVGYLFDSYTKIKYDDNGETKKFKSHQSFNLNNFRYGLQARIGVGNFSIFGYYNLSPLFKNGKDPSPSANNVTTSMKNFTIGISLSSF